MKIRSVTLGVGQPTPFAPTLAWAGRFLRSAADRFEAIGYEVQTTRVCFPPLARYCRSAEDLPGLAREAEQAAGETGVGYVALGPLRWREAAGAAEGLAAALPDVLAAHERLFGAIETADRSGVCFAAVEAAARVVRELADRTADGFGNLRFAALACCPPDVPFFPAAYHEDPSPAFGLALQGADLAVRVFSQVASLAEAEAVLRATLEAELLRLEEVGRTIETELGVRYCGADPTLAPFPDEAESIGAAFERLGVDRFGGAGTLTASALITRAVRGARGRRCGFAGVMLPVLEDAVLARRAADGLLTWEALLLYSAVCGTGLDTVPLPGDARVDELAAIILDVSTLATALQKPLTCRLLPVPGRAAGELTEFDFPFFAPGGVLPTKGQGCALLLQRGRAGEAT